MKRSDVHVHMTSVDDDPKAMLKKMDAHEVERAVVFSPYPGQSGARGLQTVEAVQDPEITLEYAKAASRFCAEAPDRLIGFVWIEPRLWLAPIVTQRCLDMDNIIGVKMIPNHWYPYEERIFHTYAAIEDAGAPILFHSGILWGFEDSSRFCRPVFYEALLHFPKIRFALAHISWPWTDECIATAGRMRAASERSEGVDFNMWIDCTPGTPIFYREDALEKALKYVGPERLLWGSDAHAGEGYNPGYAIEMDRKILEGKLAADEKVLGKIYTSNMDAFLYGA